MKGITPVVAIILLLLVTISVAGFAFMFFTRTAESSTQAGEQQLGQQLQQASGQFSIEGTSPSGQIYIRNRGSGLLANFSVFVDDAPVQWSAGAVQPGAVGPINITTQLSTGTHRVKVCTSSLCDTYALNYVGDPLSDRLVLYLPFSEGSGTAAGDASGNGNNGVISGAIWTTGKSGSGLDFDGINDWVDISTVRMPENAGTISVWVKERNSGTGAMIIGYHLGLRTYIQWSESASRFYVTKGDPDVTINFPATNRNEWHHLVLTWESGIMKSYQDGVLIDTRTFTNGATTHDAAIGQLNSANFFNGVADEVRMYNRSLSPAEITALYELDRGDTLGDGLVLYLPLNEGSGSPADASGVGNNVAVSGAAWTSGKSGSALQFDGINDIVETGTNQMTNSAFTLSFWIMPFSLHDGGIYSMSSSPGDRAVRMRIAADGRICSGVAWIQDYCYQANYSINTWHHFTVTKQSNGTWTLYFNGVSVKSALDTNPSEITGSFLGRFTDGVTWFYFSGKIDEARVYNRSLSAAEISQLYAKG